MYLVYIAHGPTTDAPAMPIKLCGKVMMVLSEQFYILYSYVFVTMTVVSWNSFYILYLNFFVTMMSFFGIV